MGGRCSGWVVDATACVPRRVAARHARTCGMQEDHHRQALLLLLVHHSWHALHAPRRRSVRCERGKAPELGSIAASRCCWRHWRWQGPTRCLMPLGPYDPHGHPALRWTASWSPARIQFGGSRYCYTAPDPVRVAHATQWMHKRVCAAHSCMHVSCVCMPQACGGSLAAPTRYTISQEACGAMRCVTGHER